MKLPVVSAFCSCGWAVSCDADDPRQVPSDHQEKQSWMDCPNWQPDGPVTPTVIAARIAAWLVIEHRKRCTQPRGAHPSRKMKLNTDGLSQNRSSPQSGVP